MGVVRVSKAEKEAAAKARRLESMGAFSPKREAAEARKVGMKILDSEEHRWAGLEPVAGRTIKGVALGKIVRDLQQPRTDFDQAGLDELAASMRSLGQLVPCHVWWDTGQRKYVLIVGERRRPWPARRRSSA